MAFGVERLDVRERPPAFFAAIGEGAFPPWLIHGDPASDVWWERVRSRFREFQIVLTDEGEPVASAWAVPLAWDGTVEGLPAGYTDALGRAVTGAEAGVPATALVVCAAVVLPGRKRQGLAGELLRVMRDLPAAEHLAAVLVPVRPTLKAAYPLTSIDVFAAWRRPDGLPLDPWLRTHERVGGRILTTAPRSQVLEAPVRRWEAWSGLAMPASGAYAVPGALAPVAVDRERDRGVLVEPNVWVRHR